MKLWNVYLSLLFNSRFIANDIKNLFQLLIFLKNNIFIAIFLFVELSQMNRFLTYYHIVIMIHLNFEIAQILKTPKPKIVYFFLFYKLF